MNRGNVVRMRPRRRGRRILREGYANLVSVALVFIAIALGVGFNLEAIVPSIESAVARLGFGTETGASYLDQSDLQGQVTHVRDGDTVEVAGVPVRIANLDCAERGTASGERATVRMRQLANSGRFYCDLEGRLSYDREVGTCAFADSRDIGEILIREGQCDRWY